MPDNFTRQGRAWEAKDVCGGRLMSMIELSVVTWLWVASKNYTNLEDHLPQTFNETFKPFTLVYDSLNNNI